MPDSGLESDGEPVSLSAGAPVSLSAGAPALCDSGSIVVSDLRGFCQELKDEGFVVVEGLIAEDMCIKGVEAIRGRVRDLLTKYGVECSADCRELFEVSKQLT